MQTLIAAFGSRGDIQPMLALALGLRAAGHHVTFTAPPNFATWIRSFGIPFEPVGTDIEQALDEIGLNVPLALRAMQNEIHRQFEELKPHARKAEVIVSTGIHCGSVSFTEAWGIPSFYVFLQPLTAPSRHHPPPFLPVQGLPQWGNAVAWSGMRLLSNVLFRSALNVERRALGLGPITSTWDHVLGPHPLYATDPVLSPLPPDTRPDIVTTGAWLMSETGLLDPELDAFLKAGPAPVYIGFGSMPDKNPERTGQLLVEAVQAANVRAVISSGWARLRHSALPDTVRVIGPAPHPVLFPRCAAIVHHGGAGTTLAATNAGVPQVIVPHIFDQFHWAKRMPALGVAPTSIPKSQLTARALTKALQQCLADEGMRERARELATRTIRDGVERAIHHIEETVRTETRATQAA